MSKKIELEDGSVYFDPEPNEMEDMEYVYLLCDDYPNGEHYPARFFDRVCREVIKAPFNKAQYMDNDEIISTLNGYELDSEKFWLALLFIYDWTEEQFIKCVDIKQHSHGMLLRELLGRLGDDMHDVSVHIRKGRKNLDVHPMIKQDIIEALRAKSEALKRMGADNLYAYRSDDFTENYPVPSYKMHFAAERFQRLFAVLERAKRVASPKRRKGALVSYNKMLLISRIVYLFRYTDNPAFLDSDDPLKGIMKDYKGRIPQTLSAIYD